MNADSFFILSQFRAASYACDILRQCYKTDPAKFALAQYWFENMTPDSLGNDLCLPVAACTAVNILSGKKAIGDAEGSFRVGDFFKIMLPFHGLPSVGQPAPYDRGWWVINQDGNVYHHAVVAFVSACGLFAYPVKNFSSIAEPFQWCADSDLVFAASLDNKFIALTNPKYISAVPGRHVVDILPEENGRFSVTESCQFLSTGETPKIFSFSAPELDKYLDYVQPRPTQGIIFSKNQLSIPPEHVLPIYIPDMVQYSLSALRLFRDQHETKNP